MIVASAKAYGGEGIPNGHTSNVEVRGRFVETYIGETAAAYDPSAEDLSEPHWGYVGGLTEADPALAMLGKRYADEHGHIWEITDIDYLGFYEDLYEEEIYLDEPDAGWIDDRIMDDVLSDELPEWAWIEPQAWHPLPCGTSDDDILAWDADGRDTVTPSDWVLLKLPPGQTFAIAPMPLSALSNSSLDGLRTRHAGFGSHGPGCASNAATPIWSGYLASRLYTSTSYVEAQASRRIGTHADVSHGQSGGAFWYDGSTPGNHYQISLLASQYWIGPNQYTGGVKNPAIRSTIISVMNANP